MATLRSVCGIYKVSLGRATEEVQFVNCKESSPFGFISDYKNTRELMVEHIIKYKEYEPEEDDEDFDDNECNDIIQNELEKRWIENMTLLNPGINIERIMLMKKM